MSDSTIQGFVHSPTLKFRGQRNYIHSTDLYDELFAGAKAAGLPAIDGIVSLEMRMPITTQPEFHFGENRQGKNSVAATFRVGIGKDVVSGVIVATNRPIFESKTYDESRIWNKARLDGDRVKLAGPTGMTPVEVVTALSVFQHKAVLPPPVGRRWLDARLSLIRPLRPEDEMAITVSLSRVLGRSITHSVITGPDGELGSMDFILGRSS